jgi:transcription antitermination factor NusG
MEDNCWNVITTRSRAEKIVGSRLSNLGINNYVPLQKQFRQWHDRKKWVELPLFPSYVFVSLPSTQRYKVFDAAGVTKYVQTGSEIARLSNEELERVKRLCLYNGEIILKTGEIGIGEEIEIIEGHFKGIKGIITSIGNQRKLKLLINGLDCVAIIENYDFS